MKNLKLASIALASPSLVSVAIKDDTTAEATALAMGWKPVGSEDGGTIWIRSEDIGVDDAAETLRRRVDVGLEATFD